MRNESGRGRKTIWTDKVRVRCTFFFGMGHPPARLNSAIRLRNFLLRFSSKDIADRHALPVGTCAARRTHQYGRKCPERHDEMQALHVAIDDHSRLAFSRMLPNRQSQTAIAFLRAAVAFYASRRTEDGRADDRRHE